MKKFITLFAMATLSTVLLASCSSKDEVVKEDKIASDEKVKDKDENKDKEKTLKVAMVTDSGTIDDKSFNQGTWEGIKKYEADHNIETQYLKPEGETTQHYMSAIHNLVDSGYEMIITPGYKFEEAIYEAQEIYPDIKFTIIDGNPHAGDYVPDIAENTSSIFYSEHEAGFYAGIVSALESNTRSLAFIGGMEMPAVQKFGWGFTAGAAYANEVYGTAAKVTDYIYEGSYDNVAGGKTLAASLYDSGVDIIFTAAGGVGVGVIDEGKTRRASGNDIWVVGVDIDQFEDGKYNNEDSVILTSAVKELGNSAYDSIDSVINGTFEGGKSLIFDSKNNGVGLSSSDEYLSEKTKEAYEVAFEKVTNGTIVVPSSVYELEAFLEDHGYTTPSGVEY